MYTLDKDGEVTPITGGGGEDTSASIWTNFGESDSSYAVLNDMLYMFVGDDENNVQLFKTDGTNIGTMKVRLCYLFSGAEYICQDLLSLLITCCIGERYQCIGRERSIYFLPLGNDEWQFESDCCIQRQTILL